jgi:D-threo-aldose 1-dehydrogenase
VLQELVAEGRVGSLGLAGGPIDLLLRFARTGIFQVVLTHNRWTLLDRSAGPLLEYCAGAGIPVLNAAPFGGGVLAQGSAISQRYAYRPAREAVLKSLEAIEGVCARHDVPLAATALQFSLREDRVISTVVGMSRAERYDAALALAAHPVPDELWDEVDELAPDQEYWLG